MYTRLYVFYGCCHVLRHLACVGSELIQVEETLRPIRYILAFTSKVTAYGIWGTQSGTGIVFCSNLLRFSSVSSISPNDCFIHCTHIPPSLYIRSVLERRFVAHVYGTFCCEIGDTENNVIIYRCYVNKQ